VVEVRALGLVETQRAGQRVDHRFARGQVAALLQTDVVVDTDPCELGDLLAAQTWHTAPSGFVGQPDIHIAGDHGTT
jgi:hypothetical protein